MSTLTVEVCKIKDIIKHPNADKLEIAKIKGWQSVIRKGEYKKGDTVVFIPPDSLIPSDMADRLNIRNYLAGKKKNRVKQVRLRKEMSYGLIIPNEKKWKIGKDVKDYYGITKYVPPVRGNMGDTAKADNFFLKMPDIEKIQDTPDIFKDKVVAITEKIDGSQFRLSISKIDYDDMPEKDIEYYKIEDEEYAIWKAGSRKVNRKRPDTIEEMKKHYYWFPYTVDPIYNMMEYLIIEKEHKEVTLFGEVYGAGISGGSKALHYGAKELDCVAFRLRIDYEYIPYKDFFKLCQQFNVKIAPLINIIYYDYEKMKEYITGKSILAKNNNVEHIREGIVIVDYHNKNGDIVKYLNPDYLLLKESGKIKDFEDV